MSEFLSKVDARRNRILEAALTEFANKGYKKASTNTIVREAKVSKGLLFHYFISKKDLYIYIFKFAKDTIQAELFKSVNPNSDGKGIGLFVTKSQIESKGGRIDLESEYGKNNTNTGDYFKDLRR